MVENGGDEVRKHLDTAPRNANYGSHVAISEYLDAISLWIQQGILRFLKEAAFYSIWLMSRQDIATIEELSICFRWVDSSGSPVEHFLGLVSLSACDAASIFAALKAFLADSDIDAGKLRGQGYDGAATFSGTNNGFQMRIHTLGLRALFVHCRPHVLQLCCISATRCLPSLKKSLQHWCLFGRCSTTLLRSFLHWRKCRPSSTTPNSRWSSKVIPAGWYTIDL